MHSLTHPLSRLVKWCAHKPNMLHGAATKVRKLNNASLNFFFITFMVAVAQLPASCCAFLHLDCYKFIFYCMLIKKLCTHGEDVVRTCHWSCCGSRERANPDCAGAGALQLYLLPYTPCCYRLLRYRLRCYTISLTTLITVMT
jgi:hypothetical protein